MKTKSKRKAQILKGLMRAAEALQEPNRLSCVQIARWTDRKYSFNVGQEFPDSEAIKYAKFVTGGKGFRSFISESGD